MVCLTTKTSSRRWNATSEKVSHVHAILLKQNRDLTDTKRYITCFLYSLLPLTTSKTPISFFFIFYVWVIILHLLSFSGISPGFCSLSLSLQSFIFSSLLVLLRFYLSFSRTGRIQPLGNQWHWFLISLGVVLLSPTWDSHRTEINCFQSSRI